MATIGQSLIEPEVGWQRIDDTNPLITYNGSWTEISTNTPDYKGSLHYLSGNGNCSFDFYGTKFRLIGCRSNANVRSASIDVYVDSVKVGTFSQVNSSDVHQSLDFDYENLPKETHTVSVVNTGGAYYFIDAIDIDETPTPTGDALLRVTMIDSSEREYRLSSAEVDGFVNWYNSHKSTDAMSYVLNDIVDNSKEYLAFEKIISFKVVPLTK